MFGFVNDHPKGRGFSVAKAEELRQGFGVQGKGAASPFTPCFLVVEEGIHGGESFRLGFALQVDDCNYLFMPTTSFGLSVGG